MSDERMQFTDLASYQRIWTWMADCGDTHQQAGEVIFSTPNMHWPGHVARPGDWITRTPTGFVAESTAEAERDKLYGDCQTLLAEQREVAIEIAELRTALQRCIASAAELRRNIGPVEHGTIPYSTYRTVWDASAAAEVDAQSALRRASGRLSVWERSGVLR